MNDYTFGNFLYELRTEKGLSQAQFGELLGVTNKAVSKWENGSTKPNTKLIPHMAQILGVTVEELFAARRLEKDTELEKIKAVLDTQRKRYALRSSVALAALVTLPMLLAEFICVVMGFGLPDDVAGPLGAMAFILSFTLALVSYVIHRSNFRRLPPAEANTNKTSALRFRRAITVCLLTFIFLLLLLPLIYFLILEQSYDFLAANVFMASCVFLLILLLGAIICLARIIRILKISAFEKTALDQRRMPWSERPTWWRILYIATAIMTPVVLTLQIIGLFHGLDWIRLLSILVYFPCIAILTRKNRSSQKIFKEIMMIRFNFESIPETLLPHFKGGEGDFFAAMYTDQNNRILKGRLPVGSTIGLHVHDVSSEIIFILSGTGKVILDGKTEALSPGDCHYCPQGHSHALTNDGEGDLVFYAVVPRHKN